MEAQSVNRNTNLDIIRILAAFMVLAVHVGYEFPWITQYTWTGYYGVTLFFSMSGYLSMVSLEHNGIASYYRKRILRIVPLYWSVLTIIFILNWCVGGGINSPDFLGSPRYFRYFFFLNMFIPSDDFGRWNNLAGFWTMSAFAFFYLIAPLIYRLVRKYYVALVLLIIILFLRNPFTAWMEKILNSGDHSYSSTFEFSQWMPLSVFYCFFLGVTVYYACKEKHMFSFAMLCIMAMVYNEFKWFAWDIVMALLVMAAAVFPSLIRQGRLQNIIKLVSSFSFALYLSHITVLKYVMKLQDLLVPYIRHKGFLIFTVTVCITVGYLAWRFIEVPMEKLLKKKLL